MEKRAIALEATGYAEEPHRVKCGKNVGDRRRILQKQLERIQIVSRAAYVEIVEKGVQRSVPDIALAYREALMGLLHQYCHSGNKKRKRM
jgi:hypothetical protein